ncbi:F-box domain-containing protein [Histoplasma capsulatum var. duboisii H88]|uniref:F-box domain-containing protein n=1 Tax=Ajellomyces capsulatus (strain H88) TaxID=544711 RepID=F0UP86_AJEC8|nr:F-box domain-containing protein [Histoplasma capsulatum var. duboisii H88]QSS53899.1 F-box domain-containing protein [Histoplasma capsulatum var. duboisii H88]
MASRVLSSTQPVASIETLPNELLDQVLSYLSPGPPPSSRKLRQVPAHSITSSTALDLKNVSRASPRFRALTRPLLFAHTRHELRDQDRFLDFLREHELAPYVQSVVVSVRSIYPGSEKPLWWVRLLGEVDPRHLTVIAPPYMFAHMALCHLDGVHSWAFELPLQTIQFHRPAQRSVPLPNHGSDDTLFSARPWTEILFNEGSSLRAYSNYEYYLLRVPSIMDHWGSVDPLQSKELPYPVAAISRLTSFHYIAVFPFYNHTNLVLKVIRNMSNLRHLSFQLAPQPNSTIFEDEQRAGTLDPNDPWMELDTSYSLISHSVRYLGVQGKLVEFRCFDFELGALRDNLVSRIGSNLKGKWAHQGDGLWLKL